MSNPETLQTIDPAALAQVSGGTTSSDDALSTALSGILEGIQSLANSNQQQSSGFNPQEMMMMMMMLNQRNQQESAAAVAPAWGTPQVYYY